MANIFQFKQFSVDQQQCAMRINTDGVLLGAFAAADSKSIDSILDIGTGTGVIALMLAQRFENASVYAVEIDFLAAETAKLNFLNAPFHERLEIIHSDVFHWKPSGSFDLIVSNPPFYINSLHNPDPRKKVAKHTDEIFFKGLLEFAAQQLSEHGIFELILPSELSDLMIEEAAKLNLYLSNNIAIQSFKDADIIRSILRFERRVGPIEKKLFTIYQERGVYTEAYKNLLKPFFLAF
ncbi:tRNA1(Val) (adenine(37)-N6)-methyltransferase [Sphingobacterium sp. HJSM2_6]|uniref:tRNA1(Val) (adenine(37)-N6)-methyltransferase n=1 Tax=Sphingobacterium sp. HJSM2_6 TaxID=3366264 RepID=UPI003BE2864F